MKKSSIIGLVLSAVVLSTIALFIYNPYFVYSRFFEYTGMPGYEAPPTTKPKVELSEQVMCKEDYPEWRKEYTIGGMEIQASDACNPDNPYEVAAFVRGTNNVIMPVLMQTQLADDLSLIHI